MRLLWIKQKKVARPKSHCDSNSWECKVTYDLIVDFVVVLVNVLISNSNLSCMLPLGLIASGEGRSVNPFLPKNSLDLSEHPSHHFCNFFVKSQNHKVNKSLNNRHCKVPVNMTSQEDINSKSESIVMPRRPFI
jgi:hypothetical protein